MSNPVTEAISSRNTTGHQVQDGEFLYHFIWSRTYRSWSCLVWGGALQTRHFATIYEVNDDKAKLMRGIR